MVFDCLTWRSLAAGSAFFGVGIRQIMKDKGVIKIDGLAAFTLLKGFFGSFHDFFLMGASEMVPQGQDLTVEKSRPTVLVIDDDRQYLETVRELLIGTGFKVLTSTSGAKGLDMMRYCQDDLQVMLLDYSMPRLNGAETLQYARRFNPQIKVIAVIDMDIDSLPISFREAVQEIITKPVSGTHLIEAINALLKNGHRLPQDGQGSLKSQQGGSSPAL
jgi:CheY-like chemotaxis protein